MFTNDLRQARVDLAAVLRWSARLGYQTGTFEIAEYALRRGIALISVGRTDKALISSW